MRIVVFILLAIAAFVLIVIGAMSVAVLHLLFGERDEEMIDDVNNLNN